MYAYYVLRTISNIFSRGSIFCIAVAYTVSISLNQYNHGCEYWYSHFPFSTRQMLSVTARGLQYLVGSQVSFLHPMFWETCLLVSFRRNIFSWYTAIVCIHFKIFFLFPINHHTKISLSFQVAIVLLSFCPIYMQLFLSETVEQFPNSNKASSCLTKTLINVVHKRYTSMRDAATIVISR